MDEGHIFGARLRVRHVPVHGSGREGGPTIRLWLVGAEVDLHARCAEAMAMEQAPFWAFCWASGQALARFVTAHPTWVRGKRVVDFGAGSGVAGIAAAMAGAAHVTAVDLDPRAREACARNAALNGVALQTAEELPPGAEVILAADVLYDETGPALLTRLRAHGARVLLADPGRPSAPTFGGELLATYPLTTLPDVDPPMREARVFAL